MLTPVSTAASRVKAKRMLVPNLRAGLPDGTKERAIAESRETMKAITISEKDDTILMVISTLACPACGADAHVRLRPLKSTTTGVEVRVDLLDCSLCGLNLTGPEEIKASDVDIEKAVVPSNIIVSWGMTLPAAIDTNGLHMG